jgi:hypothetical protein
MSEDQLRENLTEMSQACRTVLEGFDNQTFIRNTAGDHKTTWAVDQLRYLIALSTMDKISSATLELAPIQ